MYRRLTQEHSSSAATSGGFGFGRPRHLRPLKDGRWLYLQSAPDSHKQTVMAFKPQRVHPARFLVTLRLCLETRKRVKRRKLVVSVGAVCYRDHAFFTKWARRVHSISLGGLPYLYCSRALQRSRDTHTPTYDPACSNETLLSYVRKHRMVQPVDKSTPPRAVHLYGRYRLWISGVCGAGRNGTMEGYWWGPDSQHLLIRRTDSSKVAQWHISNPGDPTKQSVHVGTLLWGRQMQM